MEMHFLSEKERRELNAQRRDERDKVSSSPDCHLEQTREPCAYVEERKMRKVRDTRILNGDMSPV